MRVGGSEDHLVRNRAQVGTAEGTYGIEAEGRERRSVPILK